MPDFASDRKSILFQNNRTTEGKVPITNSGWQVIQTDIGALYEPADTVTGMSYSTDREITGFFYMKPEELAAGNSPTGGNVSLPVG